METCSIADSNLYMAIVAALGREGIRPLDLAALKAAHPPSREDFDELLWDRDLDDLDDDDGDDPRWDDESDRDAVYNSCLRAALLAVPLVPEELARVRALEVPDPAVQGALWPLWDGEDEAFQVHDLAGLEHLTGLEALDLEAHGVDLAVVARLPALTRLTLDVDDAKRLRPILRLGGLRELTLRLHAGWVLTPLAGLAGLEKLDVFFSMELTRDEHVANEALVAAMRARGVKVEAHWRTTPAPRPAQPERAAPARPAAAPSRAERLDVLGLAGAAVQWEGDTIVAVTIGPDQAVTEAVLRRLLAAPEARGLRELTLDPLTFADTKNVLKLLARAEPAPPLERLAITTGEWMGPSPMVQPLGDATAALARYPGLVALRCEGEVKLGAVALPRLVELAIASGAMPKATLVAIGQASWPALEVLTLGLGDLGPELSPKHLAGILAGAGLPKLHTLRLLAVDFLDALAPALARSPLVRRLARLELSGDGADTALAKALSGLGPAVMVNGT